MKYKRVLLKLSGEALMGEKDFGIDHNRLKQYAEDINAVVKKGIQVAIVIGGGNANNADRKQRSELFLRARNNF